MNIVTKIIRQKLYYFLIGILLIVVCACWVLWFKKNQLPADFYYQDAPIPDDTMRSFFESWLVGAQYWQFADFNHLDLEKAAAAYASTETTADPVIEPENEDRENEDVFTWRYAGTLFNSLHVVYAYIWPRNSRAIFSGIFILKRNNDIIEVIDLIPGGTRHADCIFDVTEIKNNHIYYSRNFSSGSFLSLIWEYLPELSTDSEILNALEHSTASRTFGEASYMGAMDLRALIREDGKIEIVDFIRLHPTLDVSEEPLSSSVDVKKFILSFLSRDY